MLGIVPKRSLLILCPLIIRPILSGMCYYSRHYTDEETETQKAYLPSPMSHRYSKRKPEYKPKSSLLSVIPVF